MSHENAREAAALEMIHRLPLFMPVNISSCIVKSWTFILIVYTFKRDTGNRPVPPESFFHSLVGFPPPPPPLFMRPPLPQPNILGVPGDSFNRHTLPKLI